MRRLLVFLLTGFVVAQANAQRVASGHAGGGFSAPHGFASPPRMSGGFSSGFRSAPSSSFAPRSFNSLPQYHWNMPARSVSVPQYRLPYGASRYPSTPDWHHGYRPPYRTRSYRYRPPYLPYFYANSTYLVPGLLNSYWDYPDYYGTNGDSYSSVQSNNDEQPQPENVNEQTQGENIPPPPPAASSAPLAQAAVTLVFKDGHSQQVRNYAMTKSTLYVLDDAASGRRPEIPLASIDVSATEKANQASGVDFNLPASN